MARKKVTSVPALADWGAVDNALRDIRECQHTLAEMAVQRDRQIDSIKADYAQGALPLQNRVKALESEVKAYVIESIRIAGNTIYVKNASGGYPMRDITLLYY